MAPVTRSQAGVQHAAPSAVANPFTDLLPCELLQQILEALDQHADVARASVASRRLSLAATCRLWRNLFIARWGATNATQEEAARLAGSWRALFRSKHETDAASGGWTRPSEFELQASLQRLAAHAAASAATDPNASSQAAVAGKAPPASPTGPLSAAASAAMSPAASNASSILGASPSSPPAPASSMPPPLSSPFQRHHPRQAVDTSLRRASTSSTSTSSSNCSSTLASLASTMPGDALATPSRASSSVLGAGTGSGVPPSEGGPPPAEVHLVYLLDGSGSVSEEDFAEMKKFVLSSANVICSALGAMQRGKVGVVQFSTEPRVEVPLTPLHTGADQLASALDSMLRMNGGTNIATAIARAGALMKAEDQQLMHPVPEANPQQLHQQPHGALAPALVGMEVEGPEHEEVDDVPPGVEPLGAGLAAHGTPAGVEAGEVEAGGARPVRLLLLLTDGRVDTYQAREARANACRLADELCGCTLAAFGVGRGVDRSELLHIIDTPQGDAASRYLDLYTRDDAPW